VWRDEILAALGFIQPGPYEIWVAGPSLEDPVPARVRVSQRIVVNVRVPIQRLGIPRLGHDGIRLEPPSQGGVIPARAHLVQPYCTIKPRSGKEPVGEGDGQGAGENLPIGVVLHAAHRLRGGVADGHGGAEVILVDVVERAVHAGGDGSAKPRRSPLAVGGRDKEKPLKGSDAFSGFRALSGSVVPLSQQRVAPGVRPRFGAGRIAYVIGDGKAEGVTVATVARVDVCVCVDRHIFFGATLSHPQELPQQTLLAIL